MSKKQRDSLYAEVQKHQQSQEQAAPKEEPEGHSRSYSNSSSAGLSDLDDISALPDGLLFDLPLTPEGAGYYSAELPASAQSSPEQCSVELSDARLIKQEYEPSLFSLLPEGTSVLEIGCDDLINAVFELAKGLSRLQLTEEEMALFSAAVLLSPDRPWLTDTQKVQRLQERVYLALQSCLQRSPTSKEKLTKGLRSSNPSVRERESTSELESVSELENESERSELQSCDDLINAVFELAKGLSRLQLTEEEMALFSAAVLLSPDRPWLTDTQKVQRLQECVYLALQSCLQRSPTSKEKLTKMVSKLPLMKSICNLHMDKLEFFSLVHPDTAYSFPPLYREVFGSEVQYPDSSER
ncbi:UNVERIFIED_CONTAM: hypothetical protein FKN15_020666 [Acipenser sinensis]